jgi:hypothetical protein
MSTTDLLTSNKNFLSPLGFRFQIKKAPNLNFFVQTASMPTVSLGTVDVENPFVKIPFPGDKLTFGQLDISFKVDEDLTNYLEIFNWLMGIGYPDNFLQRRNIESTPTMSGQGVYSDLSLIITSNAYNPKHEVTFHDAYPINLTELQFDSTQTDVDYLTCTVSFAYRNFVIASLT